MNVDEHAGASLASDDKLCGPHHFPRLGKPHPCPHTTDLLSGLRFASHRRGQTGFENQPFLYIFSLPSVSGGPRLQKGSEHREMPGLARMKFKGRGMYWFLM